ATARTQTAATTGRRIMRAHSAPIRAKRPAMRPIGGTPGPFVRSAALRRRWLRVTMPRPMAETTIQRFADFAANLTLDDVPQSVGERARLQAMNTVAGGLAGSTAAGVVKLREATQHWAAAGLAGVIGTNDEWEPAAAAYANAAASIAHDWDDYLYMGHT